ncbi:hypothetical protein M569_09026, partial [Genlisea aurea]
MFICGRKSFSHQRRQEEGDGEYAHLCTTTSNNQTRRSNRNKKKKKKKNPFSDRGLDKFYALVADHDRKKQQIYREKGAQHISFIRFVYSDEVRPTVVKVKRQTKNTFSSFLRDEISVESDLSCKSHETISDDAAGIEMSSASAAGKARRKEACYHYCLPAVVILMIMVLLAINGRSFAIMFTSIAWYSVPWLIG